MGFVIFNIYICCNQLKIHYFIIWVAKHLVDTRVLAANAPLVVTLITEVQNV